MHFCSTLWVLQKSLRKKNSHVIVAAVYFRKCLQIPAPSPYLSFHLSPSSSTHPSIHPSSLSVWLLGWPPSFICLLPWLGHQEASLLFAGACVEAGVFFSTVVHLSRSKPSQTRPQYDKLARHLDNFTRCLGQCKHMLKNECWERERKNAMRRKCSSILYRDGRAK